MAKQENQPGPDPERLKLEGDWEKQVEKALKRPRPEDGWPEDQDDEPAHEKGAGDDPDA